MGARVQKHLSRRERSNFERREKLLGLSRFTCLSEYDVKLPAPVAFGSDDLHNVLATLGGNMRRFRIRVLAGDRVTIEVSPYDLTRGRITFRHLDVRPGTAQRAPVRRGPRR